MYVYCIFCVHSLEYRVNSKFKYGSAVDRLTILFKNNTPVVILSEIIELTKKNFRSIKQ